MASIGDRIKELRLKRNLSQEKLGAKTGISQTYLSDIERNKANIDALDLWRISEALDYPIWQFYPEYRSELGEEIARYEDGGNEYITYKRKKR